MGPQRSLRTRKAVNYNEADLEKAVLIGSNTVAVDLDFEREDIAPAKR